ncbi:MAG TPA: flagellar FlbD family protein [Firmicutes bacterium]|nr:flagellar FlbD family protein [Bacillota bacterium]
MIKLTKLNGQSVVLNAELIETVEATPDTVISLTTGRKLLVKEDPDEITRRVVSYRRRAEGRGWGGLAGGRAGMRVKIRETDDVGIRGGKQP